MTDPLFEITFDAATGEMIKRELSADEIEATKDLVEQLPQEATPE